MKNIVRSPEGEQPTTTSEIANSAAAVYDWVQQNCWKPAVQAGAVSPYNAVCEVANRIVPGSLSKAKSEQVINAEMGTGKWLAQSFFGAAAGLAPYVMTGAIISKGFRVTGLLPGPRTAALADVSVLGNQSYFANQHLSSITGAAVYDFFRDPNAGETRIGNSVGGAAAFSVFSLSHGFARTSQVSAIPKVGFLYLTGATAGILQATTSSLIAREALPDPKELGQQAFSGGLMNIMLPHAQRALGLTVGSIQKGWRSAFGRERIGLMETGSAGLLAEGAGESRLGKLGDSEKPATGLYSVRSPFECTEATPFSARLKDPSLNSLHSPPASLERDLARALESKTIVKESTSADIRSLVSLSPDVQKVCLQLLKSGHCGGRIDYLFEHIKENVDTIPFKALARLDIESAHLPEIILRRPETQQQMGFLFDEFNKISPSDSEMQTAMFRSLKQLDFRQMDVLTEAVAAKKLQPETALLIILAESPQYREALIVASSELLAGRGLPYGDGWTGIAKMAEEAGAEWVESVYKKPYVPNPPARFDLNLLGDYGLHDLAIRLGRRNPDSTGHPESEAFIRSIMKNTQESTPHLVYADWLQEHGEQWRADIIRGTVELNFGGLSHHKRWTLESEIEQKSLALLRDTDDCSFIYLDNTRLVRHYSVFAYKDLRGAVLHPSYYDNFMIGSRRAGMRTPERAFPRNEDDAPDPDPDSGGSASSGGADGSGESGVSGSSARDVSPFSADYVPALSDAILDRFGFASPGVRRPLSARLTILSPQQPLVGKSDSSEILRAARAGFDLPTGRDDHGAGGTSRTGITPDGAHR